MNPDAQFLFRDCVVTCDISDSDRIGSLLDVNIPKGYSLDYPDGRQGQIIKVTGPFSRVIGTIFCIDLEKEKANFEGFIPYTDDIKENRENKTNKIWNECEAETDTIDTAFRQVYEDYEKTEELQKKSNIIEKIIYSLKYKFSKRADVELEEITAKKSSIEPLERPIVRKPIEGEEEIVYPVEEDDIEEDYDDIDEEVIEETSAPKSVEEKLEELKKIYQRSQYFLYMEYFRLDELEKELVDDAIAEGLEDNDPELIQMVNERTVNAGKVLFYMGARNSIMQLCKSVEKEFLDLTRPDPIDYNMFTINALRKFANNETNMLTGAELAKHNLGKLTKKELVEILSRIDDTLYERQVRHILSLRK